MSESIKTADFLQKRYLHHIILATFMGLQLFNEMVRLCSLYLSQCAIMGVKKGPDILREVLN